MIKVKVEKSKITICGHSGYDEVGKDIVCSAVSSIVITTINAIVRLKEKSITYADSDGKIEIDIVDHNEITDQLILNMLDLLKQLEKEYSKYIKIW